MAEWGHGPWVGSSGYNREIPQVYRYIDEIEIEIER